ncbi:hypothetical protein [Chitinophaga pinensis]|uniref:YD repeat-containing protein n=1 Tax=Chitinophaga pinensis TaxID=79329 RepID=A0A5C6LWY9_9BACT|nr:hypothetical protein [Chitinophaga pinensis]TWW01965.1 hypothetical protein FEF09_02160 [Chitinophaga pinensis]
MRRLLWLLPVLAACKSTTTSKVTVEKKDRIAVITAQLLDEDITTVFRPEQLEGTVSHISEKTYTETKASDYTYKDTISREYLFRDGRLHQIAVATRRMQHDTLTIRYDSAGRIQALIYSDHHSTYNTDKFMYDANGRRIEKVNRFYSIESSSKYKYSPKGDSIWITRQPGDRKEFITITEKGGPLEVSRHIMPVEMPWKTIIEQYNPACQLTQRVEQEADTVNYKLSLQYNEKGNNIVWKQYHRNDNTAAKADSVNLKASFNTAYIYDNKGNWTSKTEEQLGKGWKSVTTRKIVYN